ncbi:MAG TPA: DUF222 domain-containing protein [Acidimicrobiia bacterium]|nr:DUF222 domain-containing protein [Acidimicrobiia bacterium]
MEDLAAEIGEVAYGIQTLEVFMSRLVSQLADLDGHHSLGYSSPTNLLVDVARMTPLRARQVVSHANAAAKAPVAYQAWIDGRLSTDQARWLFAAAEAVPYAYPEAEERLVDIVEGLDAIDTRRAVEYWRQAVDGPGDLDAEKQQVRRGLSASWLRNGMLQVDGTLTPLAGAALLAGVDANNPPRRDGDTRTPRQRRHDALESLCRDWLDNGTTPTIGGEKPHINLHADLAALQGLAGGLHETDTGQIIDVDTLRMVACDCSITRIVFNPEGEVIDVGRKTRIWSPAQRRAITARDRHCQGPGCRTPAKDCDIHHTTHWADGGETSVESGLLLCRTCHTTEHAKDKHHRRRSRT